MRMEAGGGDADSKTEREKERVLYEQVLMHSCDSHYRVAYLKATGMDLGLNFTWKCKRLPYTLPSHALLEMALQKDQSGKLQNRLADDIFHAYFTDGLYPDAKTLVSLGKKVGLDPAEVKEVVTDSAKLDAAHEAAKNWSRQGVSGVPYFIINGQKAFSGAQDVSTFVRMFEIISEKFPLKSGSADASADSKAPSGL